MKSFISSNTITNNQVIVNGEVTYTICNCNGNEINPEKVGSSSRSITRISISRSSASLIDCDIEKLIKNLNEMLNGFRKETYDIFLTPFKGLRKDNKYRRRLDYALARDVINQVYFLA